jgi:hypothetical protein
MTVAAMSSERTLRVTPFLAFPTAVRLMATITASLIGYHPCYFNKEKRAQCSLLGLTLTLFMLGVTANHIEATLAAHEFAVSAHFPYRGTDFHDNTPLF